MEWVEWLVVGAETVQTTVSSDLQPFDYDRNIES